MLSYNCIDFIARDSPMLLRLIQQYIAVTELEISNINTLIQDSDTLQLLPEDLFYYKNELEKLLNSNMILLHTLRSFSSSINSIIMRDHKIPFEPN